jgi:hypothetical protein
MWGSGGGSGRKNPGSWETHVDNQDGAASVVLQKPITAAVWKKLKNLSHQKQKMRAFPGSPFLSSMSVSTSNIPPAFLLTTPIEAEPEPEQKAAKEQKRCVAADCKKKLAFSDFACRCGPRFCVAHRAAEDHKCTYDWKNEGKKILTNTLAGCVNGKVERI